MGARSDMKSKKQPPKPTERPTEEPKKPHMIGYVRVSMDDQTNRRQIEAMHAAGVQDIFEDTASGKDMKRPGWESCWKELRGPEDGFPGDILVIHSIDRLGRSVLEVLRTVKELHEKGCTLKVLSVDIDTRTPTGKFMFTMLAGMAEWERDLILERTLHGLEVARSQGRVGGHKSHVTEDMIAEVRHLPINEAARKVKLGRTQFIRRLRRWEEANAKR